MRNKALKGQSQERIRDEISSSRLRGEQSVERVRNSEDARTGVAVGSDVGMRLRDVGNAEGNETSRGGASIRTIHCRHLGLWGVVHGCARTVGQTLKKSESSREDDPLN